ncbi:MAG: histidinol-phosphate transaminase [Pseudomonadota bacterium]
MSPYKPPLEGRNSEHYTLLDFNERTIPISVAITDALKRYIDSGHLQQYPSYGDIVERLADYTGVNSNQLMITNGSDQGIDLVFRALSAAGEEGEAQKEKDKPTAREAIIPGPSFAMYTQCAKVEALALIEPQYTAEGGYPVDKVLGAINDNTHIIVIANPNNPCGTMVERDVIAKIANAAPHAAILVDECYYEYSQQTIVPVIDKLPNVFVTRTFSKTWGLPSLRFGYLIAAPDYINALCNVRGPYDINQLAIVAAKAALANPKDSLRYVEEVMDEAKPILEQWLQQQGIHFWHSSANYLWAFPDKPEWVDQSLRQAGFLVRPKAYKGQLGLRITIGTVDQITRLIDHWQALLGR